MREIKKVYVVCEYSFVIWFVTGVGNLFLVAGQIQTLQGIVILFYQQFRTLCLF